MDEIIEQNKQASQSHFADWCTVATAKRGTILGEYQKLDRLQGIQRKRLTRSPEFIESDSE